MNQTIYNVECLDCGAVFNPAPQTPLWYQADQRAKKGFLDCVRVSGEKCGCVKKQSQPNAPFRVFGYDDMCKDFDVGFETFTAAVKKFIELNRVGMYTVFISGVSESVQSKLSWI